MTNLLVELSFFLQISARWTWSPLRLCGDDDTVRIVLCLAGQSQLSQPPLPRSGEHISVSLYLVN